jgi:hypothetical protein
MPARKYTGHQPKIKETRFREPNTPSKISTMGSLIYSPLKRAKPKTKIPIAPRRYLSIEHKFFFTSKINTVK